MTKSDPYSITVKESYDYEFTTIRIGNPRRGGQRNPLPMPLHTGKIPISSAKKTDLLSLCADGTIPEEHHPYYKSLPSSGKLKDFIPEPDSDEYQSDPE